MSQDLKGKKPEKKGSTSWTQKRIICSIHENVNTFLIMVIHYEKNACK